MTLGERLRTLRCARGMTQKQLAGTCITRNMLSQIENDQARPSMRTLEYLAQTLGVDVGQLLTQGEGAEGSASLAEARELYRAGRFADCRAQLPPDGGDEAALLRSLCALALARAALADECFSEAETLAREAFEQNSDCLYPDAALQTEAAGILARCRAARGDGAEEAFEQYRQIHLARQSGVPYHLAMARFDLEREHIQAAEREIWSITELPEENRAEYLILRGRIAAKKEQFENALLYLRQASEAGPLSRLLRRELLLALEHCYKETEQFRLAYECAAAQREL